MRKRILIFICTLVNVAALGQINVVHIKAGGLPPVKVSSENEVLKRFSSIIATPTISCSDSDLTSYAPYLELIDFLQEQYPLVHQKLERKIINHYSLLYKWQGTDSTLEPDLFVSHYDVVPVEKHALYKWACEPFAGIVDTAYIWGRGTIDAKFQMASILEATENLLAENFRPKRTLYFAFGHDEETGGRNGAAKIGQYFEQQKLHFNMILDEGGGIAQGIFPGVAEPIAFISIAEKGFMNIELSVEEPGGHSSAPPHETPITILSEGIAKLNNSPMKSRLTPVTAEMLETIKPYMSRKARFALNNKWLFKNKILRQLSKIPEADALVRTSISPTMIQGGLKENAIPSFAYANLNIRSLPDEKENDIRDHIIKSIDDSRIQVKVLNTSIKQSATESKTSSVAYQDLKKIIAAHFPGTIVAPATCIATTDSHHYSGMSGNILRFAPVIIRNEEKLMMHGENERISIRNYMQSIQFYQDLIRSSNTHHPG